MTMIKSFFFLFNLLAMFRKLKICKILTGDYYSKFLNVKLIKINNERKLFQQYKILTHHWKTAFLFHIFRSDKEEKFKNFFDTECKRIQYSDIITIQNHQTSQDLDETIER